MGEKNIVVEVVVIMVEHVTFEKMVSYSKYVAALINLASIGSGTLCGMYTVSQLTVKP